MSPGRSLLLVLLLQEKSVINKRADAKWDVYFIKNVLLFFIKMYNIFYTKK